MTVHISRSGFEEDEEGFLFVTCDCGATIGFAPDHETLLDMAMEHAWAGGIADAERRLANGRSYYCKRCDGVMPAGWPFAVCEGCEMGSENGSQEAGS